MKFFAPALLAFAAIACRAEEIVFACPDVTTDYYYGACCDSFSEDLPNYCIGGSAAGTVLGEGANKYACDSTEINSCCRSPVVDGNNSNCLPADDL